MKEPTGNIGSTLRTINVTALVNIRARRGVFAVIYGARDAGAWRRICQSM